MTELTASEKAETPAQAPELMEEMGSATTELTAAEKLAIARQWTRYRNPATGLFQQELWKMTAETQTMPDAAKPAKDVVGHTPGPWVWSGKNGGLYREGEPPYTYGAKVLVPTYDYDSGIDTDVSEANAHLIAAAPELYEALWNMVVLAEPFFTDSTQRLALEESRRALARARGEVS